MGAHLDNYKRKKKARKILAGLFETPEHVLIVHYSCESFYDRLEGRTSRITSIAVRNLASGQTRSFSIHKVAEQQHVPPDKINAAFDPLEKEMLDEYFEFARAHQNYIWVHWNMRDINYGFQAIEHRYRVLGGNPLEIQDASKTDLARLLIAIYGVRYAGHPRLESLMNKNSISHRDFLVGSDEAGAFEAGDFVKLHQSTLRKVDVLANLAERAANKTLVTEASFFERNGPHPAALMEIVKDHWIYSLLGVLSLLAGFLKLFGVF